MATILLLAGCSVQQPYPYYTPDVTDPIYDVPTVMMDATHNNRHQSTGSYYPFAELLRADGYRVRELSSPYQSDCSMFFEGSCDYWDELREADIFVTAHTQEAVSENEAIFLARWVFFGGALFIITDHSPNIDNILELLKQLNISPSDIDQSYPGIVERSQQPWDDTHPIILGRNPTEEINTVSGNGRTGFAIDNQSSFAASPPNPSFIVSDIDGVGHTAVLEWGDGRVVFVSDGAPLTEQSLLFSVLNADGSTCDGMWGITQCLRHLAELTCASNNISAEDCKGQLGHSGLSQGDNQQFLLNIIHWLDGII